MNYITIKHLKALRACREETQKFKETFGESLKFDSLEEAQELAIKYAKEFDLDWIGEKVFGKDYLVAKDSLREAYQEALAPVHKIYQEAEAPLWKAYEEAEAPLREAYEEARAPLLKAYRVAESTARRTYREAIAPLWKAYQEAVAPVCKAREEAESSLWKAYKENCAKLFATMWWGLPESTKDYPKRYTRHD